MDLLKELQEKLEGRNLSEVARRAGMARDNVARLASGKQDNLYIKTYARICEALKEMDDEA